MNEQQRAKYTPQFVQKLRFMDRWQAVIPGMAAKTNEVKQTFLERVKERGFAHLSVSPGLIEVEKEQREYDFVELLLDTEKDARAIMAARIAPFASDLFVEWQYYVLPPQKFPGANWENQKASNLKTAIITGVIFAVGSFFGGIFALFTVLLAPIGILAIVASPFIGFLPLVYYSATGMLGPEPPRHFDLQGFQSRDGWAFKESVNQALREALDVVGISAEMIREMPKEKRAI